MRAAEKLIVDALPEVLAKVIEAAKGGDMGAAKLLLERAWGKAPTASRPIAEDDQEPPDDPLKLVEQERERKQREIFAELP